MNSQDLRKDNVRRTDTNSGENRTQRKVREDRRFASNEDKLLCPLTQYFLVVTFWGKEVLVKIRLSSGVSERRLNESVKIDHDRRCFWGNAWFLGQNTITTISTFGKTPLIMVLANLMMEKPPRKPLFLKTSDKCQHE